MEKKLKKIAQELLDLSKRNRLINYKDSGLKAVNILNDNLEEIFYNITSGKVYKLPIIDDVLKKYHNDLIINKEEDDVLNYSDLKVKDICLNLMKPNELLIYKRGYTIDKTLKSIHKEYEFYLSERGINPLYITFYMLKYKDKNEEFLAPILLIPVNMSVDKGIYKISEADNDIILNPTLAYYIKTNYKINLKPYDEEQDNLSSYILEMAKALNKDMEIINQMSLGQYSFLKMNMYNDLTDNISNVLSNDNVKALLGDDYIPYVLGNDSIYPVVDADSSQLEAIKMASRGESFVLEGPPGSGKSQTITNIIASLIGNGKHVLFVSEKLAALNVVYENLRRVGLEEFAIELHSAKANKKDFVDELYKTAISPKKLLKQDANNIVNQRDLYIENIKSHYNELHKKSIDGIYSLYDLYSMYLDVKGIDINFRLNKKEYSFDICDKVFKLLEEYKNYAKVISIDYKNSPFYGIDNIENEYLRYDFKEDLLKSVKYLKDLIDLKNKIKNYFNFINVLDIYNSIETINKLASLKTFEEIYLNKKIRLELIKNINDYLVSKDELANMKAINNYSEKILDLDIEDILIKYKEASASFFKIFNSTFKSLNRKILAYRKDKAKPKKLIDELNELLKYKELKIKVDNSKEFIDKYISNNNLDIVLRDLNNLDGILNIKITKDEYNKSLNDFKDIVISSKNLLKSEIYLANVSKVFDNQIFNLYNVSLNEALNKLEGILNRHDDVKTYLLMQRSLKEIKNLGFIDFLDFYVTKYPLDNIGLNFKKLYLKEYIYSIVDKSVFLSDFNSYDEKTLIEEFRKLDLEVFEINKDKIISLNTSKRPDDTIISGTKFKILINEHNKERRQKPIRELLNNIFELALDIKPIFLMSPLSVSTYLSSDASIFDTVIFDEASQIYASDAIGAIYRAKQAIIIGDSKQMPPSNFFDSQSFDEDDDDDSCQSILDLASVSYKMLRLKWHYRSRSEELIQFSNWAYYDNSLITIPQAKRHTQGFGIDFVYLKNGRYDTNKRTNLEEAKLIKDMVFKHLNESDESLGVVAFSDVQAKLISSLIEDEIKNKPSLSSLLTKNEKEPFFVKNLETVQGDERDRIIFSICYGYNNDNKFYQRFGPLNNLGGEKRLNVAITRAKYNITVVSSIRYSDIRTDNTDSVGVKNLKQYLEFIENITLNSNKTSEADGVITSVASYLSELGYKTYTNYGSSEFKIDLAVMKNDQFILAIMVDKSTNKTVTDNERLIPLLLNRLGWRYFKLYSTAWINNPELEKKNLLDSLSGVKEEPKKVLEQLDNTDYLIIDNRCEKLNDMFLEYIELDKTLGMNIFNKDGMEKLISTIIEIEAPIHEDYLYKRIANILDLKVTNVLKNRINNNFNGDLIKKGKYYYNNKEVKFRTAEKRDIDYISSDELMAGIYAIVKKSNGISKEGCYKELLKLIGYNRLSQGAVHALDNAVIFLSLDGKLIEKNGCLYL